MAVSLRQHLVKALVVSLVLLWVASVLICPHTCPWDDHGDLKPDTQVRPAEQEPSERKTFKIVSRTVIDAFFDGISGVQAYKKQKEKGEQLSRYLLGIESAGEKGETQWTAYEQLGQWGWTSSAKPAQRGYVARALKESSQDWGAVDLGDLNHGVDISWRHSKITKHAVNDGSEPVQYPPTGGYIQNTFFTNTGKGGVIFAMQNNGPRDMIEAVEKAGTSWKDAKGHRPPIVRLEKWSDIVGLTWLELTKDNLEQRKSLRWVHRGVIINVRTKATLGTVARKRGFKEHCVKKSLKPKECEWQVPEWPGFELKPGTEEFHVVLGAPNAYGVAWLLIQHKAALGDLTIKSVRAWNPSPRASIYAPALLFELGPVWLPGSFTKNVGRSGTKRSTTTAYSTDVTTAW